MIHLKKRVIYMTGFFAFLCIAFMISELPTKAANSDVEINSENFPDAVFRDYVSSFDKNKDGILSQTERKNVSSISVNKKGIKTLKGIEHFGQLSSLYCSNNSISTLDLSRNRVIFYVEAYNCEIEEIDISGCEKLSFLNIMSNKIKNIDLSDAKALISLDCDYNEIEEISLENNTELNYLMIRENSLKKLDVSKCTKLSELNCADNQISTIDIRKNPAMTQLNFQNNKVSEFLYEKGIELDSLNCGGNGWSEVDISDFPYLTSLQCANNQLTHLDVSMGRRLHALDCSSNKLSDLTLGELPLLSVLKCDDNQLKELSLTGYPILSTLTCKNNYLKELDLSQNAALQKLDADNNPLFYLDLSSNGGIRGRDYVSTKIEVELVDQQFDLNQIKGMDISKVNYVKGANYENGVLYPTAQKVEYWYNAGEFVDVYVTLQVKMHEHALVKIEENAPTCVKDGNITYYTCACGKNYFDEKAEKIIEDLKDVILPKTKEHKYSSGKVVPASFEANGKFTEICTVCGKTKDTNKISKLKKVTLSENSFVYDGKKKAPTVKVTNAVGEEISESFYKVTFPNGKGEKVGSYPVRVSFWGLYQGEKTVKYKINPISTKIQSLQGEKKSFIVQWEKKTNQVDGYTIQYSLDESFSKQNTMTINIKSNDTRKLTVKKLKANQRYYVRVCTYKKVSGEKYSSSWSKVKSVVVN